MAPSSLDRTVDFLAKRDGIDKVLKIIRYTTKFALASHGTRIQSEYHFKLQALDSSLGTTRKAFRLGKFLSNVKSIRQIDSYCPTACLQLAAALGEGVYYFLDQGLWLIKAGVLDKKLEPGLSRTSAWAELVGYAGNISLNLLRLQMLDQSICAMHKALAQSEPDEWIDASCVMGQPAEPLLQVASGACSQDDLLAVRGQLAQAHRRKTFVNLMLLQDFADATIAINEVTGGRVPMVTARTTALCGLISAFISSWKNWPS